MSNTTEGRWSYFGCHQVPGHRTFSEGMRELVRRYGSMDLSRLDGLLPHQTDTTPYIATVTRLGGWGLTALAWWDRSVDSRSGSNSIIFAPSLHIAADALLVGAQLRFPQVFSRLPRSLLMYQGQP